MCIHLRLARSTPEQSTSATTAAEADWRRRERRAEEMKPTAYGLGSSVAVLVEPGPEAG